MGWSGILGLSVTIGIIVISMLLVIIWLHQFYDGDADD